MRDISDERLPLLGAALGDGLGAGVEGSRALQRGMDEALDEVGGRFFAHSPFGFDPGEVTDDTQMGLAALWAAQTFDGDVAATAARLRAGYDAWFRSHPPDVGNATRASLAEPGIDGGWTAWGGGRSAGNGSLMRCAGPIALGVRGESLAVLSAWDSALTHPDPSCVASCVFATAAIDALRDAAEYGAAVDHGLERLQAFDLDALAPMATEVPELWSAFLDRWAAAQSDVATRVRRALGGAHVDCTRAPSAEWPTGWVLSTLEQAVWAAGSADDFGTCLRNAVLHGGHDADSIAAAAGALTAARFGRPGLESVDPALWTDLRLAHTWSGGPPPGPLIHLL